MTKGLWEANAYKHLLDVYGQIDFNRHEVFLSHL